MPDSSEQSAGSEELSVWLARGFEPRCVDGLPAQCDKFFSALALAAASPASYALRKSYATWPG